VISKKKPFRGPFQPWTPSISPQAVDQGGVCLTPGPGPSKRARPPKSPQSLGRGHLFLPRGVPQTSRPGKNSPWRHGIPKLLAQPKFRLFFALTGPRSVLPPPTAAQDSFGPPPALQSPLGFKTTKRAFESGLKATWEDHRGDPGMAFGAKLGLLPRQGFSCSHGDFPASLPPQTFCG